MTIGIFQKKQTGRVENVEFPGISEKKHMEFPGVN